MLAGKPNTVTSLDVVMKSEEPKESIDTIFRQTIGKDSFTPFQRAENSPVQWIQMFQALDQQELPGWPLLTPLKVQMQKCDKCTREFCSPINCRRHIRVHHRLKKLDKDFVNIRNLLGEFWDKLSSEEAKEVASSFNDVWLEEVPGSSIVKALSTLMRKSAFPPLPQAYLRAGYALLDIVQGRSSRYPISSQELFSILDDASEKTFLRGTAVAMQRYVFDGEAGKIGLEAKNLVACTSFLLEQQLVNAWLADKDAESLRCQKLLMEEEEAAKKRQAELLERKRQKKLRQKELRAREQRAVDTAESQDSIDDSLEVASPTETSSSSASSDRDRQNSDTVPDEVPSTIEPIQFSNTDEDIDCESQIRSSNGHDAGYGQDFDRQIEKGYRHTVGGRRQARSQRGIANGFHAGQKPVGMQKHANGFHAGQAGNNVSKIWSQKYKPVNDVEILNIMADAEARNQQNQKANEVLIGSISIPIALKNRDHEEANDVAEAPDSSQEEHQAPKRNLQEKPGNADSLPNGIRSVGKCWRPVSRGNRNAEPDNNGNGESVVEEVTAAKDAELTKAVQTTSSLEKYVHPENHFPFDPKIAKEFLAQRWKAALEGEHMILMPSSDSESSWNAEENPRNTDSKAAQAKFRTKPEKGTRLKYVPKQRNGT